MARKKDEKRKNISVYFLEKELETIRQAAELEGNTISSFVRQAALKASRDVLKEIGEDE